MPPSAARLSAALILLLCDGLSGFSPASGVRAGADVGAACRSPLFVRLRGGGAARHSLNAGPAPRAASDEEAAKRDGFIPAVAGESNVAGPSGDNDSSSNDQHRLQSTTEASTAGAGDAYVPPYYAKSSDEEDLLRTTLGTSIIFGDLPRTTLDELIGAFSRAEYIEGTEIIHQGDTDCKYMYVLMRGECAVSIDGKPLPGSYGTMTAGTMIGELGLLYGKARAATIAASTDVTVFRLDRTSFRYFIKEERRNKPDDERGVDVADELLRIDEAIDMIAGIKNNRYKGATIIREFRPQRRWLWFRWTGTILQHAWKDAVKNMLMAVATIALVQSRVGTRTWISGTAPDAMADPIISRLATFGKSWHYIMSITTFILTFFLSQAYTLWRRIYDDARKIQGRLNDIGLLVAAAAKRGEDGLYTPESAALLDDVALFSRLFHTFMWAKFATKFSVLLEAGGMRRMVSRGLMTSEQCAILRGLDGSVGGPHSPILQWITTRAVRGMEDGTLENDEALRRVLYEKVCLLRGTAAGVGDVLDGRMPLAYGHLVQILVDVFLFTAPFALYAELGSWSVLCVGILTLFYSGLLDLSKIFLDPLDNDNFYHESVNMDVGVLIREGNAGSTRWKLGAERLPF